MTLALVFLQKFFIWFRKCPCTSSQLVSVFITKVLDYVKHFVCIYSNDHVLFFILCIQYITLIDFQILHLPCISRINPSWSQCIHSAARFSLFVLKIFTSITIRDINHFLVMSGFGIRYIGLIDLVGYCSLFF